MKRLFFGIFGGVALVAAYLLAWPIAVHPVSWQAPAAPGYVGPHAVNQRLAPMTHLPLAGDVGPEHVVIREEDGVPWIWMAVATADRIEDALYACTPTDRPTK
jgi:hypothetical protein